MLDVWTNENTSSSNTPRRPRGLWDELGGGAHRPNVLVLGAERATQAALEQLTPLWAGPVHVCRLPGPLQLPDDGRAALILHNVDALDAEQQSKLSQWLEEREGGPVVSLSSSSLFDLVLAGTFNEQLYYRLNTVLEVADGGGFLTRTKS